MRFGVTWRKDSSTTRSRVFLEVTNKGGFSNDNNDSNNHNNDSSDSANNSLIINCAEGTGLKQLTFSTGELTLHSDLFLPFQEVFHSIVCLNKIDSLIRLIIWSRIPIYSQWKHIFRWCRVDETTRLSYSGCWRWSISRWEQLCWTLTSISTWWEKSSRSLRDVLNDRSYFSARMTGVMMYENYTKITRRRTSLSMKYSVALWYNWERGIKTFLMRCSSSRTQY